MYRYSTSQIAIITAVPTVTVLLIWTLAIFYKNKKQWRPYDICIVAILIQSVLRNLSTLCYTILTILAQSNDFPSEYCTATIWLFNSLHTFQASTLSTLSVVGLYVMKLSRKHKEIKQYLTSTHIVYHLFCLTTLCACVGVAAILARHDSPESKSANFEFNYTRNLSYNTVNSMENCKFMPFDLDIKYNIFILSLHSLLAFVSIICFLGILFTIYKYKRHGFDYLKKSTSDLSDLSLGAAASTVSQKDEMSKNYFDTFQKSSENTYLAASRPDGVYSTGTKSEQPWTSDTSQISTSVSSTNSRRPCLKQKKEKQSTGLETIMPVLIVCYLFNHLPVVVVCVFPWLPTPWTNGAGAALWLGLTQDVLVPTALGLVDGRFNLWVSKAYRCGRGGRKTEQDRPPKGLDGKFRPFTSTTQTLEAAPMVVQQVRTRPIIPPPMNQMSQNDHKFPITNGSLYTSIDGRLPIIHNYRRHKVPGLRSPVHSISMGLHSTYVKRQESIMNQRPMENHFQNMEQCDDSFISLPADYTSLGTLEEKKPNMQMQHHHQNINTHVCMQSKPHSNLKHNKKLSSSQNSLSDVSVIENELRKMRLGNLSKSQNNLNEINVTQRDIQKFRINPEMYQKQNLNLPKKASEKDIESSDDEYFNHSINYADDFKNYDTISSLSCCSITTEANGDFEFFAQQTDAKPTTYQFNNDENTVHSPTNDSYMMKLNPNLNQNRNYPVMRSFKPLMCKISTDSSSTASNSFSDYKTNATNHVCVKSDLSRNFRIRRSNSKQSLNNLDTYIKDTTNNNIKLERSNSNRSCDLFRSDYNKGTYVIRSNSNRSYDIMRSNPNISETNQIVERKPSITHVNLRNLNSSCIHFNEKNEKYNKHLGRDNLKTDKHRVSVPVLSMESLSSMLNQKGVSYLDNGDACNHNYGGSVPDFKKVFVTDFI